MLFTLQYDIIIFNIEKTDGDRSRLIEVSWAETNKGNYNAELLITANDRTGLLVDITLALNELKIPLRALNAKTTKNMLCLINITLEIDSYEKLSKAITRIKGIKEVIGVSRTNK